MEELYKDGVSQIMSHLSRRDLINLTSVSVKMYGYRDYFFDNFTVDLGEIDFVQIFIDKSHNDLHRFLQKIVNVSNVNEFRFLKMMDSCKLRKISFDSEFNESVDNLPDGITHLTFRYFFNQSVDNLPSSLTHLILGHHFNQSIDNLPSSITHLTLNFRFNKPINNLPSSLSELTLDRTYSLPLDKVPSTVKITLKN